MKTLQYTAPDGAVLPFGRAPYAVSVIGGLDAPEFLVQTERAPGQDGATYIDGQHEPREIVVEGAIAAGYGASTAVEVARRALIKALNPKLGAGVLRYISGTKTLDIPAIPVSCALTKNPEDPITRFQIQFLCPDPYYRGIQGKNYTGLYISKYFEFQADGYEFVAGGVELSILAGISGQRLIVQNGGDVSAPIVLTLRGPALNPKIQNVETGEYLQITKALETDEVVEINTAFGNKTITITKAGTKSNGSQYLDAGSTFFHLPVGASTLEFSDSGGQLGAVAIVTFFERYIGV